MAINLLIGFLLALVIAAAARRARTLSRSGTLAALVLGTCIFGLGGLGWAILLMAFFISSSALSRLFKKRKQALDEKYSKGSERDAAQVLANGGVAGLFAVLHAFFPGAAWPWIGCAAALAAANADTWATELGVLNPGPPVLITSGKPVEKGTSGGISAVGSLAALAGAGFVALFGALFWQGHTGLELSGLSPQVNPLLGAGTGGLSFGRGLSWFGLLALSGLLGSLVDSLLGATLQAIYRCPNCQKETERHPLHSCGAPTVRVRGLGWLNNDWVNTACTLAGAVAALILISFFA
jgi:uncharacterized protein (TIGR00297 family)